MDKKQIACGRKLVNLLAEGLGCSSCAPIAADADIRHNTHTAVEQLAEPGDAGHTGSCAVTQNLFRQG